MHLHHGNCGQYLTELSPTKSDAEDASLNAPSSHPKMLSAQYPQPESYLGCVRPADMTSTDLQADVLSATRKPNRFGAVPVLETEAAKYAYPQPFQMAQSDRSRRPLPATIPMQVIVLKWAIGHVSTLPQTMSAAPPSAHKR